MQATSCLMLDPGEEQRMQLAFVSDLNARSADEMQFKLGKQKMKVLSETTDLNKYASSA